MAAKTIIFQKNVIQEDFRISEFSAGKISFNGILVTKDRGDPLQYNAQGIRDDNGELVFRRLDRTGAKGLLGKGGGGKEVI